MCASQNWSASPGLVLNAAVLWNTRYLGAAVARLRAEGHGIKDEDVARLSHRSEVISTGGQADCASEARRRPGDLTVV